MFHYTHPRQHVEQQQQHMATRRHDIIRSDFDQTRHDTTSATVVAAGGVYFHAYDGGDNIARRSTAGDDDNGHYFHASSQRCDQWEMREEEVDDEDEDEEEPMDILYEQEVFDAGNQHHRRHGSMGDIQARAHILPGQHHHQQHHPHNFHRHHSEPIHTSSFSLTSTSPQAGSNNLELQITNFSDHLLALLQREANIYAVPLPMRYYPTEFVVEEEDNNKNTATTTTATIGPWRKRIASWMFDVVDHFQYDRNVVSIALWYIDRYVGHVLLEEERNQRRNGGISGNADSGSQQPIKRRQFQLIAVTSLYLAIKVHGELKENDPVSGDEYDVVASLVHEVDGRAFLGKPIVAKKDDGKMEDEDEDEEDDDAPGTSQEIDEEIRAVSQKINDLKRRHRMGRWSSRLSHSFGLPLGGSIGGYPSVANNNSDIGEVVRSTKIPNVVVPNVVVPTVQPHSHLPYKPRKRGMLSGPLRLHSFVELSRGLFTSKDITDTEMKILLSMNYVVNPPTSRRVVGELLRSVALSYCRITGQIIGCTKETLESAAKQMLGFDLSEILSNILNNACQQIEAATSKPTLSIGCLPSTVAYGAMLNAVEDEFDKIGSTTTSPQLEDFQRHYQRYSRAHSPSSSQCATSSNFPTNKERLLDDWKNEFLVMVFHATNGFLSPESDDILRIRELLLDPAVQSTASSPSPETTSPSKDENKLESTKKRSPRSPRSIIASSVLSRDSSLFASQSSTSSMSDSASLLSPYNSMGSTTTSGVGSSSRHRPASSSFRSKSGGAVVATAAQHHRVYYKQMSEPMDTQRYNGSSDYRYDVRAQTPNVASHLNELTRQLMRSNQQQDAISCRTTSTGEVFQPPNHYPLFFSA